MLKRVLQINIVAGTGSTGRIANGIEKVLKCKGIEGYIAYGRGVSRNMENRIKVGNKFDMYFHIGLARLFDMQGFASVNASRQLVNTIKQIRPDIIHLHNIHGYYLNFRILFDYLSSAGIPVVWTFHDLWPVTGHCVHPGDCERFLSGCFDCKLKKEYPASLFLDRSRMNYLEKKNVFSEVKNLNLVSPSIWLGEYLKKSFLNKYPIMIINNGINLNIFFPRERRVLYDKYNVEKDKFVVLGVASSFESKTKGFGSFLDMAAKMGNETLIILVGVSKNQIKALPQNIRGIEKTEDVNMLAELYTLADVFCNPTLEDNFPTVNLEAMACGTPVVAFNTGGIIEQIAADCGYVVSKGDIVALVSALNEVKMAGRESFSKNCIELVQAKYDENDRFNDYVNLYETLI